MMGVAHAPAVHTRRRSRWTPSQVDASIGAAMRALRGTPRTVPILHQGEVVGLARSTWDGSRSWFSPVSRTQWCGFTGYEDLNNKMRGGKDLTCVFWKDNSSGCAAATWADLWGCQNQPIAGTYTGTANTLRQFDNKTVGALQIGMVTPGASETRHIVGIQTTLTAAGVLDAAILYDRVGTYESSSITTSTITFDNTLPPLRYVGAGQEGLLVSANNGVGTANGATPSNLSTLTFTDQNGNTSVNLDSTFTIPWAATLGPGSATSGAEVILGRQTSSTFSPWIHLAANVSGVRQLTTAISSAINTGTVHWILLHPLASFQIRSSLTYDLQLARSLFALERVYNDACMSFMIHGVSANTGHLPGGTIRMAHG